MTPKQIIERHEKFPTATEKLIESYAFSEYKKAIADLEKFGRIIAVENSDTTIIVMSNNDFQNWKQLKESHWYLNQCSFIE